MVTDINVPDHRISNNYYSYINLDAYLNFYIFKSLIDYVGFYYKFVFKLIKDLLSYYIIFY